MHTSVWCCDRSIFISKTARVTSAPMSPLRNWRKSLCGAENDVRDWDTNVPGLFDNSAVRILDGRNAKSTLI